MPRLAIWKYPVILRIHKPYLNRIRLDRGAAYGYLYSDESKSQCLIIKENC